MIVIGVDPGKTTGYAAYDTAQQVIVDAAQLDRNIFVDFLVPRLEDPTRPRVDLAVERFVIAGGTLAKGRTDENWSIEQIGILRHWARRFDHNFTLQPAGDAMKLATNDRLRQLGWYRRGQDHTNDALRHVLLRLASAWTADFERLLATVEL